MLRLLRFEHVQELTTLRAAWNGLVEQYPCGSTCMTWEWLTAWWSAYHAGRTLLVLALFDDDRLVGLAPLALGRHRIWGPLSVRVLDFLGDGSYDSDHLDAPVLAGYGSEFARALLGALAQERGWDLCRLNLMPEQSRLARHMLGELPARGWWSWMFTSPQAAVTLPASWEEYLASLSPSQRRHLRRYTARLERRYSVRVERCVQPAEIEAGLHSLFELHQLRWRRRARDGSFASPPRRHFYRELAPLLQERGDLHLWVLRLGDVPAAVQFAFRHGDTVFQLQEGFDPRFSSDRPGTVLRCHVLRSLVAAGVRRYDYLGGYDAEKARWGAVLGRYRSLHFARGWSWGGLYLALRRWRPW